MTKHQRKQVEDAVDKLIDRWATQFTDDEFLEALSETVNRVEDALHARREELGR